MVPVFVHQYGAHIKRSLRLHGRWGPVTLAEAGGRRSIRGIRWPIGPDSWIVSVKLLDRPCSVIRPALGSSPPEKARSCAMCGPVRGHAEPAERRAGDAVRPRGAPQDQNVFLFGITAPPYHTSLYLAQSQLTRHLAPTAHATSPPRYNRHRVQGAASKLINTLVRQNIESKCINISHI